MGEDKTTLFVVIGISVIVIIAMVIYIWKRRANRYKFKKDEIFDEILDRGHMESDHIPESNTLNDSFGDGEENVEHPKYASKLTS